MVPLAEIEANDYNLNIPRYIDSTEPEDLQDIEAHLLGGIPNRDIDDLAPYWEVFPTLRQRLFCRQCPARLQRAAGGGRRDQAHHLRRCRVRGLHAKVIRDIFARWQADNLPRLKGSQWAAGPSS